MKAWTVSLSIVDAAESTDRSGKCPRREMVLMLMPVRLGRARRRAAVLCGRFLFQR
jgi:hypothetical protein